MVKIGAHEILQMEKLYRVNLINGIAGYKPLHLLGTINNAGITNLCIVSSVFHLGSNPALLGVVMRPQRENNDTLKNIKETGFYTLNNVLPSFYEMAHQTSAGYPSGQSEFAACGFEAMFNDDFKAPFVMGSTIRTGMELKQVIDIEINRTAIVIGQVSCIFADEQIIGTDGNIDHVKAGTITNSGADSYYLPQLLGRLTYAKPGSKPVKI